MINLKIKLIKRIGMYTLFTNSEGKYFINNSALSWSDAKNNAEQITARDVDTGTDYTASLVKIDSANEQSLIETQLNNVYHTFGSNTASDGGGISYIWIGGSDIQTEGSWVWTDDTPLSYTNWGDGAMWNGSGQSSEPDNYNNQDALAIGLDTWPSGNSTNQGLGDFGEWNDIDVNNLMPSIIELPSNVDRISTSTNNYAFDMDGNAGLAAKILGAVFGTEALSNQEYVGIGLNLLDGGMDYESLMQLAIETVLGDNLINENVVDLLYTNVVGSAPSQGDKSYFVDLLENGTFSVSSLGILAADTDLNINNINLIGLAEVGLEYI